MLTQRVARPVQADDLHLLIKYGTVRLPNDGLDVHQIALSVRF